MTRLPFEFDGIEFCVQYNYSAQLTLEICLENNLTEESLKRIYGFIKENKSELMEVLIFVSEQYHSIDRNRFVSVDEWESDLRKIEKNKFFNYFNGYIKNLLERTLEREKNKFYKNDLPKQKERRISNVYLMKNNRNGFIKIGYSLHPEHREKTLQSEEPEINLIFSVRTYIDQETFLHEKYKKNRLRGEWFSLSEKQIISIKKYLLKKEIK